MRYLYPLNCEVSLYEYSDKKYFVEVALVPKPTRRTKSVENETRKKEQNAV